MKSVVAVGELDGVRDIRPVQGIVVVRPRPVVEDCLPSDGGGEQNDERVRSVGLARRVDARAALGGLQRSAEAVLTGAPAACAGGPP